MMDIVYKDERHHLEITREKEGDKTKLFLKHRGCVFLDVNPKIDEIKILKDMYNRIVDNHNQLKDYFANYKS